MRLLRSELSLHRVALLVWGLSVAALMLVIAAVYPSIHGNDSLNSIYGDLSPAAQGLLGGSNLTSPVGYLNTQVFAFFLPVVVLVFGLSRGSASLAGEEENRTLDLLLAQPITRRATYLQKFAAMALGVLELSLVTAATLWLLDDPVGLHLATIRIFAVSVQMGLFCLALAAAAQAIAAAAGRRVFGTAAAAGYAFLSYLIYGLAPAVPVLRHLRPLSLWRYYLGNEPLSNGFGGLEVTVLVGATIVALVVGTLAFQRRDLRA